MIFALIIITITMALFAAIWKTGDFLNAMVKLWFICLTVAGAICISYYIEKGTRIDTTLYLWCSSVTIWLFALTWQRKGTWNIRIRIYLWLLSVICIMTICKLYV